MRIEWTKRMVPNQPTPLSTGQINHELELRAVGCASEIEWLNEQIAKIGDKVNKTADREG
jgi:hypothetical protein